MENYNINAIKKIHKPVRKMAARFWTKTECKTTLKQCKAAGFTVTSEAGLTKIHDGENLVVSWIAGPAGGRNLVRVDLSYFG